MSEDSGSKLGICKLCGKDVYDGKSCKISGHLYHEECGSKVTATKAAEAAGAAGVAKVDQVEATKPTKLTGLVGSFEPPDRLGR